MKKAHWRLVNADGADLALPDLASAHDGQSVLVGFRPHNVNVGAAGIEASVKVIEPTGSETELLFRTRGGNDIVAVIRDRVRCVPGELVHLDAGRAPLHL